MLDILPDYHRRIQDARQHADAEGWLLPNTLLPQIYGMYTVSMDALKQDGKTVADVERLLVERPAGVKGLAVAGMPMGSPGMEHGNHRQAFQVIAFGPEGHSVWASYPASH